MIFGRSENLMSDVLNNSHKVRKRYGQKRYGLGVLIYCTPMFDAAYASILGYYPFCTYLCLI